MDRINSFLGKRVKKNERTLRVQNKRYKITKDDIMMVRVYRKCKNVSGTKLAHVEIRVDEKDLPVLEKRDKYYNKELYEKRFMEKYQRKWTGKRKEIEEEIYDIYAGEKLSDYKQEWVYDLTAQYNGRVEDLETKDMRLLEEIANKYRTPVEKSISVEEIIKYKSDRIDLGVSGQFEFGISEMRNGQVRTYDGEIYDIIYGNRLSDEMKTRAFEYTLLNNILYKKEKELLSNVIDCDVDGNRLIVLYKHRMEVYENDSIEKPTALYRFKKENLLKVKCMNQCILIGTTNGITRIEESQQADYTFLNYVVDFTMAGRYIFAINNTKKIVCIDNKKVISEICTGGIGRGISVYERETEYLIGVLFINEVKVYRMNKISKNIVPCYGIDGRYSNIRWNPNRCELFVSEKEKTTIFS
ncbi:hypothetical protein ECANGB1_1567 [Enterospora canceri]|uniref:Uncharacterized protein n=1 Tax=Enterospora canceri TaxID=1081671 RepID=A0A1Y1S5U3_9MICR|nr:hypothetical protein ECANGB1_1567 [Enterospora canceri]